MNKHLQCSLGKIEIRTIINLMVTLSIMISEKCLNSTLQDAVGNKKTTEHADTSFLNAFLLCNRDVLTKMVLQLFIIRLYYNPYARGPWIKIA